jgi:hypothetical protein
MRAKVLRIAGLAVLALVALGLAGIVLLGPEGKDTGAVSPVPAEQAPPIEARVSLRPATVYFGDTVTARVDITLDRSRVDPESVILVTSFDPWQELGDPQEVRREGGTTTHLRTTWRLRCLLSVCLPPAGGLVTTFDPATVTYRPIGANAAPADPLLSAWPRLVQTTRLDQNAAPAAPGSGRSPFETPWRADLVSMPAVSYRVDPDTAGPALFGVAGVLALLGFGLAYAGRPRRRPQPVVEAPPPPPPVSPLEQALALLEDGAAVNGSTDRRRALELVAAALASHGDDDLARHARDLAWSRHGPEVTRTTPIADQARPLLGFTEDEEEKPAEATGAPEAAREEEDNGAGA